MLARLDAALMKIEYASVWLAGVAILMTMFLVTAEVVARGIFNAPIQGQVDIVSVTMVAYSLLCISYCYRQSGHIRMDMLQKAMRGRAQWLAQIVATIAGLAVVLAILPGTWTNFMRAYEFGDTTMGVGLPTWPSKLAAPVGLGLLAARLTLELWVYARLIADPSLDPIGVPAPPDPSEDMDA